MNIAIIGKSRVGDRETLVFAEKAKDIGSAIVDGKHTLLTGACHGFPMQVSKYVYKAGGEVIGYSPGKDIVEHKKKYKSPTDYITEWNYIGGGLMKREIELVLKADLIVALNGNIGTLTEIMMSIKERKNIIVLKDFKIFVLKLNEILSCFTIYPKPRIQYLGTRELVEYIT